MSISKFTPSGTHYAKEDSPENPFYGGGRCNRFKKGFIYEVKEIPNDPDHYLVKGPFGNNLGGTKKTTLIKHKSEISAYLAPFNEKKTIRVDRGPWGEYDYDETQYREVWNTHVNQLNYLKVGLSDQSKETLNGVIKTLSKLIEENVNKTFEKDEPAG